MDQEKYGVRRTQQEIVEHIRYVAGRDVVGWIRDSLLLYLDYEHAKQFLKDDVTEEQWAENYEHRKPIRERMIDYLDFAFEKARNQRGLSAWRSICHYQAWLWLDGDDELWREIEEYSNYGYPQLIEICRYLDVDVGDYA